MAEWTTLKVLDWTAKRFGEVSLRLVIDAAGPAPADDHRPAPVVDAAEEEEIDLHDLVDAPSEPVRSGAEKLVDAFPGAELVEEDR